MNRDRYGQTGSHPRSVNDEEDGEYPQVEGDSDSEDECKYESDVEERMLAKVSRFE